jgi:hypothetical protein
VSALCNSIKKTGGKKMKKLLVIPILIICIVFLGGCNNEGKDAITARCDEFITMYEGTEHDDYRIDNRCHNCIVRPLEKYPLVHNLQYLRLQQQR